MDRGSGKQSRRQRGPQGAYVFHGREATWVPRHKTRRAPHGWFDRGVMGVAFVALTVMAATAIVVARLAPGIAGHGQASSTSNVVGAGAHGSSGGDRGSRFGPSGASAAPSATPTASPGAAGESPRPAGSTSAPTTASFSGPVHNVEAFRASPSLTDNSNAFMAAIAAAERDHGVVYVPAGLFRVASDLRISSPITFAGAGRDLTTIQETASGVPLLSAKADGTVVQDVTLDSATHNGSFAFGTAANHTQLLRVRALGSSSAFTLYYAGPPNASRSNLVYSTGNVINDVIDVDNKCDDGVSWSFQSQSSISNLRETGSRLALYIDNGVRVSNMNYTPGACAANGYYITGPSQNISIDGFYSSGSGGEISPSTGGLSTNISISNEHAVGGLVIGSVTGLSVSNSSFGTVGIFSILGAAGTWVSSSPSWAFCTGAVTIAGLSCK